MITIRHCLAVSSLLLLPSALRAQHLKWTEVTKQETRVSMPGGKDDPEHNTTWISGGRIRSDNSESSTITDFAGGRFTQLDHKEHTFWSMTFPEMLEATRSMMAQAEGQARQARPNADQAKRQMDSAGVKAEFDVKVDHMGGGPQIAGYSTERSFVTLVARFSSKVVDPTTGEPSEGSLVFAADVYHSKEFPGRQARLDAARAATTGAEVQQQAEAMATNAKEMMAMPGMEGTSEGLARLAEELEKIEGEPLKTLSYVVTLGPGVTFDRQALVDLADKPIPTFNMAAAAGGAAKQGVKDAVKDAIGIGGLFGRKKKAEPAGQQDGAKSQTIQMRTTTTVESVSRDPIPEETFRAPASYKERKPDWMKPGDR